MFTVYFFDLTFTAPLYTDSNSYKYHFWVSDAIKNFPTYKPMENSDHYGFSIGRHDSLASDMLIYHSQAPATEIISYYQLYFDIVKYRPMSENLWTASLIMYQKGTQSYFIIVTDMDTSRKVTVERYG